MQFRILGSTEVVGDDGAVTDVPSQKQRTILALLLLHAGDMVPAERIIDALWPGDDMPQRPRRTLGYHVSKLRDTLEPGRKGAGSHELIVTRQKGYAAEVDRDSIDLFRFERLVADATAKLATDPRSCAKLLDEALGLWRGPPLADFDGEPWAMGTQYRLSEEHVTAMETRIEATIAMGELDQAIAQLESMAADHPYRESITCLLMMALYRNGRQGDALQAYRRLRTELVEQLGIEPSEATRELEQRILEQDPTLIGQGETNHVVPISKSVRDLEMRERIAEGRFGIVYRAHQHSVGREVALKVIRPEYANQPEFLRRFEAEAQLVARLEHPHIVPLYDFWRDPEGAYLLMRWLRGGSLQMALERGPWTLERTVRLMQQICAAAGAAHRQGVIHRDLKPANILLDEDGNAYLSDFGVAKFLDSAITLTRSGGAPASPAYAAPEQLDGETVTPQADVYALGIITYEMLAGRHPFPTTSVAAVVKHHFHDPVPRLRDIDKNVPHAVDAVIATATAKDPAERFSSVRQLSEALSAAADDGHAPHALLLHETNRTDEATVADYVTHSSPFGPIAMDPISTSSVYEQLYDAHSQVHQDIAMRRPSYIVGRRGAGKTALLRLPLLDPSSVSVEFSSADVFAQVLGSVAALERHGQRLFSKHISDIWEGVAWTAICLATLRSAGDGAAHDQLATIQRYLSGMGSIGDLTVDAVAAAYCRRVGTDPNPGSTLGLGVTFGGVSLAEAKTASLAVLDAKDAQAVVLIDSMEDLQDEFATLTRVLAGLFGLIGRSDRSARPECDFRLCYPSELWTKLSELAANPLKDAENHLKITWSARELVKIASHRLSVYLKLYHPSLWRQTVYQRYDPASFDQSRTLLRRVLPDTVRNQHGDEEHALAYVMRHTQLLPRHLLQLLNGIARRNQEMGGGVLDVRPEAVVEGVRRVEELLVAEVFTAYSAVHPHAREACQRVLPELPKSFGDSRLHKVFNQTGVAKATGLGFLEFKEMMVDIGCMGRVMDRTERYIEGEFDYTLPTPLLVSTDDELCVHPLFARVFRSRIRPDRSTGRPLPIYPYGTDPDHTATW